MRHLLIVILRPILRPFGYLVGTLGGRIRIMRRKPLSFTTARGEGFSEARYTLVRRIEDDYR